MFEKYHEGLSVKNNMNHASGGKLFGKYNGEGDAKCWDAEPPSEEFWNELFRTCDYLFIWGGNYFPLPPSRNFIVWEKTIPENFSMAMCELCWTSVPGNAKIIKCGAVGLRPRVLSKVAMHVAVKLDVAAQEGKADKFRFHPTQKPRFLYDKIFQWYGEKYMKPKGVIDPFLGSGSSRLAAYDAGIDFVGIELNKLYFEKEEARFKEHIAGGNLWEDIPSVAESGEALF